MQLTSDEQVELERLRACIARLDELDPEDDSFDAEEYGRLFRRKVQLEDKLNDVKHDD